MAHVKAALAARLSLSAVLLLTACALTTPSTAPPSLGAPSAANQSTPSAAVAEPTASPAPSPSPTPSPSPDPAAVKAAAAKAYKAVADRFNKTSDALAKTAACKSSTLKNARACAAKYATAEHTFYVALNAILVPADTEADKRALVRATTKDYTILRLEATSKSIAEFNDYAKQEASASTASTVAANILRLDLGLPVVPIN